MTAYLRSLIAGVLYPMVPIIAELLIRANSEVRLETWVITAVVYFAAIGLASSNRAISDLSLWFTGVGAVAYGTIALAVQLNESAINAAPPVGVQILSFLKSMDTLPIMKEGAGISAFLILAFTLAYAIERYKRHVVNREEF